MAIQRKPKIIAKKIISASTTQPNWLAECGPLDIGIMQRKIKTAIDTIILNLDVNSAYGFGSFFRGELFRDVDILFTTEISDEKLPDLHRSLSAHLSELSLSIGYPVDFTLLTRDEFSSAPLRDHAKLVKLA